MSVSKCEESGGPRRARYALEWAAVLVGLLGGCSSDAEPATTPEPPSQQDSSAPAGVRPAGAEAQAPSKPKPDGEELGVAPSPRGEQVSPEIADKYARRDAAADGWTSEVLNSRSEAQLKALAKGVLHPEDLDEAHVAELLDSDFRCVDLRPECAAATTSGAVRVARNDSPPTERVHVGAAGAVAALRDLRAFFGENDVLTAKFKTIAVVEDESTSRTSCYAFFKTVDARPARQLHATWRCEWNTSAGVDSAPKLLSIEIDSYEESVSDAPLFEEATSTVFAGVESFERQLAPSLEHWAGRIERQLGMSVIGHEGLALGDVDGDGLDDLYVCQPGGLPNRLYVRSADGSLRDTSREAGVDFLDASRGALFVDLDNDGDQDLAVELDPWLLLLENDGTGRFVERARSEVASTTSLSAADYDGDGDADLYCCGYVLPDAANVTPLPYHDANNGRPNTLLRNDIDSDGWKFVNATAESGLDENNRRFSFAASWEDYDDDGDLDLYVSNDFGRNNLYRNDGGRFKDVAAEAGVEDMAAGMGVSWGDFDRDGRMDLHVSNMFSSAGERVTYQRRFLDGASEQTLESYRRHARGDSLFRNLGDGRFEDVSEHAGITMGRWAWGAVFLELDNDGWPDLFVPNGFVTGEDPEDL